MIQSLPYILIAIIPPLGMLSGLSLSASVVSFFIILIIANYKRFKNFSKISIPDPRLFLLSMKVEILLITWCFICSVCGIAPFYELKYFFQILIIILVTYALASNIKMDSNKLLKPLVIGIAASIIIFYIEYVTEGTITREFRINLQNNAKHDFYLFYLDRGCAFISVLSFILLKLLTDRKEFLPAILLYTCIAFTLYLSDSLSSFIAYLLSGIALLIINFRQNLLKFSVYGLLVCTCLMPVFFYKMDPYQISDRLPQIPVSAKHRLFIWNFVAHEALKNPILGIGLNGSKYADTCDFVEYQGLKLDLFPLHPHNNILQILIELGIPGFILALILLRKKLINTVSPYMYAAFICYFIIGAISFNMWQSWWVFSAAYIYLLSKIFILSPARRYK